MRVFIEWICWCIMEIKYLVKPGNDEGLFSDLLRALRELGIKPDVEILRNVSDFIKYKVRAPAAIVINEKVVFRGHHDLSDNVLKAVRKEAMKEGLI